MGWGMEGTENLGTILVKAGMRTAIIAIEANMSRKQITAARKRLQIRGSSESGPLPQAENILGSRTLTLEASLFMQSYLSIAHRPKTQVDILSVLAAHSHYLDCHAGIRDGKIDTDCVLDLDRAWVLARDFRSIEVGMRTCHDCRIEFVAAFNDRRQACPICSGIKITTPEQSGTTKGKTISEFVELAGQIAKQLNWGNTDDEIAKDLNLTDTEYELAKVLSRLSPREIRMVIEADRPAHEVVQVIRNRGSVSALAV